MKKTIIFLLLAMSLVLPGVMTAYAGDCSICTTAKEINGWCEHCQVGYMDGQKMVCRECFDLKNSPEGGYCEHCEKDVDGFQEDMFEE